MQQSDRTMGHSKHRAAGTGGKGAKRQRRSGRTMAAVLAATRRTARYPLTEWVTSIRDLFRRERSEPRRRGART